MTGRTAAALLVVLALAVAPVAAAAPATTFVSKEYGYTLELPGTAADYTSDMAFVNWTIGTVERNVPEFDTITDNRADRSYIVGARRPPAGNTLAAWTAYFTAHSLGCKAQAPSGSTLAGTAARIFTFVCGSDGWRGVGVTAVHGGRGYFLLVSDPGTASRAADARALDAARRSFRFSAS
jgi:hypothetical protein